MKVIVVGCGKVGKSILESMADEKHDVVAIDNDPEVIQTVANTFDVMAVCGNATKHELLSEAGVAQCDLFIAVTTSDEVNMLSCFLAKRMGAKHTVARIREFDYNDDGLQFLKKQLDLSMALNPELLTAEALFDMLKLPSAVNVDTFAGRKIQILELLLRESSKLVNVTLSDLRKKTPIRFLVCAVQRGEETFIPNGNFQLQVNDRVAFMIKRDDTHKFLDYIGLAKTRSRDVIILGGSTTAYYLIKLLSHNKYSVKVIEKDEERCAELAESLPSGATVICGDGMKQDLLWEEGIRSTDAFVALTGRDEENILISFYAIGQQVPKVIAKVNQPAMATLAEKLGLDCVVSPQKIVADVLTRYARALNNSLESKMETLYSLLDGDAEAMEFKVLSDCKLIGIPLRGLILKEGVLIAGIIRNNESIIPSGDDTIVEGDRVIIVATKARIYDLADILR